MSNQQKLKDVIAATNPDLMIKVGATKGSGFFWVGTTAEYLKYCGRLDREAKLCTDLSPNESRKEEFVYPSERVVVDSFEACRIIDNALILMVEGMEAGKYWTVDDQIKADGYPIGLGKRKSKNRKGKAR
jgi:hypothetical protein